MIALLLLMAAVIITFLDISHYWLDDETKNILYFDTNNSSSNEDTSDSDTPDASESEVGSESDSEDNKTSDSSDQESSFEDQILEELNQEMKKSSADTSASSVSSNATNNSNAEPLSDLDHLDDLDDLDDYSSDKDEVRLASHTISAEEAAADVEAIFRQFKGGKG